MSVTLTVSGICTKAEKRASQQGKEFVTATVESEKTYNGQTYKTWIYCSLPSFVEVQDILFRYVIIQGDASIRTWPKSDATTGYGLQINFGRVVESVLLQSSQPKKPPIQDLSNQEEVFDEEDIPF